MQGIFGSLMGVFEQLMQMLQSLMGYGSGASFGSGGCNPPYGSSGPHDVRGSISCPPSGNERFFQNATAPAKAIRISLSTARNGIT